MSPSVAIERLPEICRILGIDHDATNAVCLREPGRRRHAAHTTARVKVITYLRELHGMSWPEIRDVLGFKSHNSPRELYARRSEYTEAEAA